MNKQVWVRTGEILPLDYGIVFTAAGEPHIRTPTNEARAKFAIATPTEKLSILGATAEHLGIDANILEDLVRQGVQRKHEGSTNVLDKGGRDVIKNARVYDGNSITALVGSQEGKAFYPASFTVRDGLQSMPLVATPGKVYGSTKGTAVRNLFTAHVAALSRALAHDQHLPQHQTITDLPPRERTRVHTRLPFPELGNPVVLGEIIAHYYGLLENSYTTSTDFIDTHGIGERGIASVHEGKARFAPIRYDSRRIRVDLVRDIDQRRHASTRAMIRDLKTWAEAKGFGRAPGTGYVREFPQTPFETIGALYRKGDLTMSIVGGMHHKTPDGTKGYMPPVVVFRRLTNEHGEHHENTTFQPFSRETVENAYQSIDDATRRVAETRVLVPGLNRGVPTPTSNLLRREYVRWLE